MNPSIRGIFLSFDYSLGFVKCSMIHLLEMIAQDAGPEKRPALDGLDADSKIRKGSLAAFFDIR